MALGRLFGISAVFVLGITTGGLLFHLITGPVTNQTEAQARAIKILEKSPVSKSVSDNRTVEAVKMIEPAVVNIDTIGHTKSDGKDDALVYMDQEIHGKGSGVILSPDGYIVTNSHVIDGASRIRVTVSNGRWYYARLIGKDPDTDLAVIRIQANHLSYAEMGDSDKLQVGEWSIAVGNPLGLGSTVTLGVVSALNRHNLQIEEGRKLEGAIQTDAPINRGNSGGALANINGQLIGINTAILSSGPNGGSIGLGFALPINTVRRITHDLIATGRSSSTAVAKPWLGVAFSPVPLETARAMHLLAFEGVQITQIFPDSPAATAGLQLNDVILSIEGKEIGEERDVREAISQQKSGDKVTLHIIRSQTHKIEDIQIKLQSRPLQIP